LAAVIIWNSLIRPTIEERMKINFDEWISEQEIRESDLPEKILEILKRKNLTYEKDGALWFKSTEFGDDKDRVLITSEKDGREQEATYVLPDAACHYKKFVINKFDRVVDIWGADHHGYVARLQAFGKALGVWDENNLKIIIIQLVRLFKGGEEVKMSKRAGTYITLDELLENVPLDVARFFFLMYSTDTHMDFNLDLARERSEKNPVYYVQYAHARISSILKKAAAEGAGFEESNKTFNLLKETSEMGLIKQLIRFPEIVEDTAKDYQMQRLPQYSLDLVRAFHKFYEQCRVISEDKEKTRARLSLVEATRVVLKSTLALMGISAPEKM
jgi:arginyl-tRNA synthetase